MCTNNAYTMKMSIMPNNAYIMKNMTNDTMYIVQE